MLEQRSVYLAGLCWFGPGRRSALTVESPPGFHPREEQSPLARQPRGVLVVKKTFRRRWLSSEMGVENGVGDISGA